jgi:hypothetical protein
VLACDILDAGVVFEDEGDLEGALAVVADHLNLEIRAVVVVLRHQQDVPQVARQLAQLKVYAHLRSAFMALRYYKQGKCFSPSTPSLMVR